MHSNAMDDTSPLPKQRPLEKHCRIEADLFCDNCGYNLHSQPVVRDEHTGILVARCTECGRFQAVANASNASRVWLLRLSAIVVALWGLILLAFVIGAMFGLFGLQMGAIEGLSHGRWQTEGSSSVYRTWDPTLQKTVWMDAATDKPITQENPKWMRTFRPAREIFELPSAAVVLIGLWSLAPTIFGCVLAVAMWHVSRVRLLIFLLIPLLAGAITLFVMQLDEGDRAGSLRVAASIILAATIAQLILTLLGMNVGRPVARFLAKLFIPPKPRQAIAFLWSVDGKKAELS